MNNIKGNGTTVGKYKYKYIYKYIYTSRVIILQPAMGWEYFVKVSCQYSLKKWPKREDICLFISLSCTF